MHISYITETHNNTTDFIITKNDKHIHYHYNADNSTLVDILEGDKITFTHEEWRTATLMFRKWLLLVKNNYNGNVTINGTEKIVKEILPTGKHQLELSRTGSTVRLTSDTTTDELELQYIPTTGTAQLGSLFRGIYEAIKWGNSGFAVSNTNLTDVVNSIVREEI